ncbi:hypothetical protein T265_13132, partial [Opisthorchis viverrini]
MRSNGCTRNNEYQHSGSQPNISSTQAYDCKGSSTKKRRTCDSSDESASTVSMEPLSHQTVEPDDSSEEASSHRRTNPPIFCFFSQSFVRRVVDDTLDRTITFCEQPRQAIIALEHICAKAWPQLELKRHRNRIRAYLKACRRNSKKNKGHINMKEPPMNGLSIEARHLVANALSLVCEEVNQLKRVSKLVPHFSPSTKCLFPYPLHLVFNRLAHCSFHPPVFQKIHLEHAKNLTLRKPSISPSKNNYTLPDAQESHFNTNSLAPKDISLNSVKSQTESPYMCGENVEPDIFSTNRYDINLLCKPMPTSSHSGSNSNCKNDATLPGIGTTPNLFPPPSSYDNMYMAAMLRLLPSVLQHPLTVNSPNDTQSSLYAKSTLSSDRLVNGKLMNGSPISAWNTSNGYNDEKLTNDFGNHPRSSDLAPNRDKANAYIGLPYEDDICKPLSRYSINCFTEEFGSSMPTPEAPPAHINAIQYSFSLKEAVQRLTDVRILTK